IGTREADTTQANLQVHRTSCCTTRLHAPQPLKAAASAAAPLASVEITSPAANTENRRSRITRALAAAVKPLSARIGASAMISPGRRGWFRVRPIGNASALV